MKARVDVTKVLEELATRNGAVMCQSVARCQGMLLSMGCWNNLILRF